jgi:RNA recognition motif-containing protein
MLERSRTGGWDSVDSSGIAPVEFRTKTHLSISPVIDAKRLERRTVSREEVREVAHRLGFPDPEDPNWAPSESCDARRSQFGQQLSNKIYVGNLPFSSTEDELRSAFATHGDVESVNLIMDRDTGRPRGFAFVEMADSTAASKAIRALDGSELGGRNLRVNEAEDKRRGGGFGGR